MKLQIGKRPLEQLPEYVARHFPRCRIALVTDPYIARWHGRRLIRALQRAGQACRLFLVPRGERAKTRAVKAALEDRLFAAGYHRDTVCIALGGGSVGDLVGFTTATYLRGVPYLNIPTTLVAQTDSAIGGKTAIDTAYGKNLLGAFYLPHATFIDPTLLTTLAPPACRQGLVEMMKHGCIADVGLAHAIAAAAPILRQPTHRRFVETLLPLLRRSIAIKRAHVDGDLDDRRGKRALLNYGHTFGHALEQASHYRLAHGDAVAIGMTCAAYLAHQFGILSADEAAEQTMLLRAIGAPTNIPATLPIAAINRALRHDKKIRGERLQFILLRRLGQAFCWNALS